MFRYTHTPEAPWYTVEADEKRRARLNCISHVVDSIEYEDVLPGPIELTARPKQKDYERPPREANTIILEKY
jgi:hypothetical protein